MFSLLHANGPHPSLGNHADTYAGLIGSWRGTYRDPHPEGEEMGPLDVRFAWVLEGRAVQDIWMVPCSPTSQSPPRRQMYGTTLRVFDPTSGVWRVDWFNPLNGARCALVGKRIGDQIVQTGYWDGRPQRWRFLNLREDSFTWQSHRLEADGQQWELQSEFLLQRVS